MIGRRFFGCRAWSGFWEWSRDWVSYGNWCVVFGHVDEALKWGEVVADTPPRALTLTLSRRCEFFAQLVDP